MATKIKSYHSIDIESTMSIQSLLANNNETSRPRDLRITVYFIVIFGGLIFCLIFFYRGSLSPIVDVLEQEFHATSSQIGKMASLFYVGYTVVQIPSGFALEILSAEFLILTAGFGFTAAAFLFGLSQDTSYASTILSIAGVLGGPVWISCLALMGQRMGNNAIPLWSGIQLFYTYFFLMGMNTLQAYLWDEHYIWREVYFALAGSILLVSICFLAFNLCDNTHNDANDQSTTRHKLCFSILRERHVSSNLSLTVIKLAFCNPWNYVVGLYNFAVAAIILGFNGLWLIPFLMNKYGYERSLAVVISNLFFISSAIGGLIMGKLSTKYKKRKIFLVISSLMLGGSSLIVHLGKDTNIIIIAILNCISGCGAGCIGMIYAVVREYNVFYSCEDIAGGLVNTIGNMSGVVFPFVIGYLMDVHWMQRNGQRDEINGRRMYNANDYEFAFISIDIAIGFAIIVSLVLKETNGQTIQFKDTNNDEE
eukprot:199398_1